MPRPHSAGGDTLADTVEVVVKFTAHYHPEAHRLLTIEGFALVLHACVPVYGSLFMVMMDLVHGEMAWDTGNRGEFFSCCICKDIQVSVARLHSRDLDFGDLRTLNIMVIPGGFGSDDRRRGILIDPWNRKIPCYLERWSAGMGVNRYPAAWDH